MPESIISGQLLEVEPGEVEPGDRHCRQRVDERGEDPGQELNCRELGMGTSEQNF